MEGNEEIRETHDDFLSKKKYDDKFDMKFREKHVHDLNLEIHVKDVNKY